MKCGSWLIIDNSGKRHWVLENGYCGPSDLGGWEFKDSSGVNYVSGDAFVKNLNVDIPMDEFLKTYKQIYNIPEEQNPIK